MVARPNKIESVTDVKVMISSASGIELEKIWIPMIMRNQEEDELDSNETIHNNGIGLNGFDARTITPYYNKIMDGKHLTERQVEIAKRKLSKYAGQYLRMTNN